MTVFIPAIFCKKSQDYKTEREIELEEKLKIAVQALEEYANTVNWSDCILRMPEFDLEKEVKESCYANEGYKDAQEALAKIKEIK